MSPLSNGAPTSRPFIATLFPTIVLSKYVGYAELGTHVSTPGPLRLAACLASDLPPYRVSPNHYLHPTVSTLLKLQLA